MDSMQGYATHEAGAAARFTPLDRIAEPPPPHAGAFTRHELELLLDRVAPGLVAIDRNGRVLHANRTARELLARLRGTACAAGTLFFPDATTQAAFRRALAVCSASIGGPDDDVWGGAEDFDTDDVAPARQFLVRDAQRAVIARASIEPLRRGSRSIGERAAFLVSLHQQPDVVEIPAPALMALYGLTRAEARIAAVVVAARSIDDLAARLELSRNTVKSHLKRVFRKCEVSSLAQLSALVATGPRLR